MVSSSNSNPTDNFEQYKYYCQSGWVLITIKNLPMKDDTTAERKPK